VKEHVNYETLAYIAGGMTKGKCRRSGSPPNFVIESAAQLRCPLFPIAGFSTPVQYKNKEEKLWKVSYKAWIDPYSYFMQKKNRHLSASVIIQLVTLRAKSRRIRS
jgi:hypothetical protein